MEKRRLRKLNTRNWEDIIDYLTSDMDPQDIDLKELSSRYRTYINELEKHDLRVSARAIRILATLLNLKIKSIDGENPLEENTDQQEDGEDVEEEDELEIDLVSKNLDVPIKPHKERRVSKSELKHALKDALKVEEQRNQRQEERHIVEQQFEPDRDSVKTRINQLYERVQNMVDDESGVEFDRIVEDHDQEETIEKFKHVLTLEGDQKVDLVQQEFLGNLKVVPEKNGGKQHG